MRSQADPCVDSIDVTALFRAAQEQLAVGELISIEDFSLFEAMSAVEVGNVKMDAGAAAQEPPVPLGERPLPLDLSPEQQLALMDQLLALEASWQCGNPLAQTVYSSLYMLQLPRLGGMPALAAYCQGLQATCIQVHHIVMQGGVCEEEDFNVMTTGLPVDGVLPGPDTTDGCVGTLTAAIDAVQDGKLGKGPVAAALAARLSLRKALFQGLSKLARQTKQDVDAAAKCFRKALTELEAVRLSSGLGAASEPPLGFDLTVNAHLTPMGPPRMVQLMPLDLALAYTERLLRHLIRACAITGAQDWPSLKAFLSSFADMLPSGVARSALHMQLAPKCWEGVQGPLPAWVPTRAMLMHDMYLGAGAGAIADVDMFLEQSHIACTNWVQVMLLNRARQRRRLRRMLEDWANMYQHALNADVSPEFQAWATGAGWRWKFGSGEDADPHGPLATWIEREACCSMLGHLLLGCELELYEPQEYAMIYWYCDFIVRSAAQAARQLLETRPLKRPALPAGAGGSPGGASKGGSPALPARGGKAGSKAAAAGSAAAAKQQAAEQARAEAPLRLELLQLDAMHYAFQGMLYTGLALQATNLLPEQKLLFNTWDQRFDQRFACFHQLIRPEPLTYEHFMQATSLTAQNAPDPGRLLGFAHEAFMRAQQACGALAANASVLGVSEAQLLQAEGLKKVAQQNSVAVMLLARMAVAAAAAAASPAASSTEAADSKPGGGAEPAAAAANGAAKPAAPQLAPTFDFKHLKWVPGLSLKTAKKAAAA